MNNGIDVISSRELMILVKVTRRDTDSVSMLNTSQVGIVNCEVVCMLDECLAV